jgi:selenocysteine lyase/cysteine desulfurase
MRHGLKNYIRFSLQAFNTEEEIDVLISALQEIKKQTNLIL